MKQQKKQQLGENVFSKNFSDTQLKEIIHKLQQKDASQRLDISRLKEVIQEITQKYHKALKQIGEMEKIQKRDFNYILKIDSFLAQTRKKVDEPTKKQQTETYVDALLEMTRQRDELKKKNGFLEIRIIELQEANMELYSLLERKQIQPQQSQQQFTTPLQSKLDEIVVDQAMTYKQTKRSSIFSNNTQDSINNYDLSFDQNEDNLMQFLQQLDEAQATQLYSLFSQMTEEDTQQQYQRPNSNQDFLIRKMLQDSNEQSLQSDKLETQQSAFSFTQKMEGKENLYF